MSAFIKTILFYVTSFILAVYPATTYVEGVTGQPQSFFPHQARSQNDVTISNLVYRGLFKYDIYGALVPDLAESWAISEEGIVYTIKLKDDQYWSDGTQITADDLIYTSFKHPLLQGVATDKVDNLTVRFTLPNKFSPFLSLLTVGIMRVNSEENYNSLEPVTSGPFRLLSIKRSGPIVQEVVLLNEKSDDEFRKLVFRYYTNEDELVTAAQLGEIDGFVASANHELDNFQKYEFPLQGVYYSLIFNLRNEKLQDVETRRSLEKVLNKDDLIYPFGIAVEGAISRSSYTDDALEFDAYDKDFVGDLKGLELTLTLPDLEQHEIVSKKVQDAWEDKLNAEITLNKVAPAEMQEQIIKDRNFEVLLYGQEVGRDPDRYINWHSTQQDVPGLNLSGFEQIRADRALEEGRNEPDSDIRFTHYQEFQRVVHEQVPAIFLYHPFIKYYVSDYIKGIGEKYTFRYTDRFLDFSNWSREKTN
ncbi:MAG: ABC transporter substrate-binding protein [Patescibacteria group bacterium]